VAAPTTSVKLKNKLGTDIIYENADEIQVLDENGNSVVFSYANFSGVTAVASDVMSGKYFLNSNKELVEGTRTLVQLNPPTISIPSGSSTLNLTDGNNGTFATQYRVKVDGVHKTFLSISTTTYNLANLSSVSSGTHIVTVSVLGTGMAESQGVSEEYVKPLASPTVTSDSSMLIIQNNDTNVEYFRVVVDGTTTIDIDASGNIIQNS